mgnify:CR=1 FL=1
MKQTNYSTKAFEEDKCRLPDETNTGRWYFELKLNSGTSYYICEEGTYADAKKMALDKASEYLGCYEVELVPGA